MKEPRVSVLLPVFNGARSLARQLDSIIAQSFGDFKVLLIDNASTDETEDISRQYAAQDPRVLYFRNSSNFGFAFSYKRGYYLSQDNEFMVYASHTDYWHPDYLQACVQELERRPMAALAYSWCQFVDEDERPASIFGPGHSTEPYKDDFDLMEPDPVKRYLKVIGEMGMCTAYYGLFRMSVYSNIFQILDWASAGNDNLMLAAIAMVYPMAQVQRPLFFRELPAVDQNFKARRARLLKFGQGDAPLTSTSAYMWNFMTHLHSHLMLVNTRPWEAPIKNDLSLKTIQVFMQRYKAEFEAEIKHNVTRVKQGLFYSYKLPQEIQDQYANVNINVEADDGRYKYLDITVVVRVHNMLSMYAAFFPQAPELFYGLALTLVWMGRPREALGALEQELHNDPTSRQALELKAQLARAVSNKKEQD